MRTGSTYLMGLSVMNTCLIMTFYRTVCTIPVSWSRRGGYWPSIAILGYGFECDLTGGIKCETPIPDHRRLPASGFRDGKFKL
jgi:hypothetical protein